MDGNLDKNRCYKSSARFARSFRRQPIVESALSVRPRVCNHLLAKESSGGSQPLPRLIAPIVRQALFLRVTYEHRTARFTLGSHLSGASDKSVYLFRELKFALKDRRLLDPRRHRDLSHPWARSLTGRDAIEYITDDVMTFFNLQLSCRECETSRRREAMYRKEYSLDCSESLFTDSEGYRFVGRSGNARFIGGKADMIIYRCTSLLYVNSYERNTTLSAFIFQITGSA